jgi:hypothetical protein
MVVIATRDRELESLADMLEQAWSRDSSADPERWTVDSPACGQCAVTALVVQDEFGGDLLRTTVDGLSHYWNRLPDGSEVDLTRQQFAEGATYGPTVVRDREYVLSFPDTVRRYLLLRRRVGSSDAMPGAR